MSKPGEEVDAPEAAAIQRLESAVSRLLGALTDAQRRVAEAENKSTEMAGIVERFTGSQTDARELMTRLSALEAENEDLRTRLERGREGVERMIARIRFLENQG